MPRLVLPADKFQKLIRRRRETGADRKDEVWNGVYVMAPDADNVHDRLTAAFAFAFRSAIPDERIFIQIGGNVSDRDENWTKNFRRPDVLVYYPENPAEDRGTHYVGGPDFAVEVISPGDRSRKKFDFYARVGVRELLIVDRKPWRLELYRLRDGRLEPAGASQPGTQDAIASEVLPVTFRLVPDAPRPRIEVAHRADDRVWRL